LLATWRARKALLGRTPPTPIDPARAHELVAIVDALGAALDATTPIVDAVVHVRREGRLQVIGLDARCRSRSDVRQRVLRVAHEMHLAHIDAARRRVLAVILREGAADDLREWTRALVDETGDGKSAERDWRAARKQVALLVIDPAGRYELTGGDHDVERAVRQLHVPG
jgi:hypothetical protein